MPESPPMFTAPIPANDDARVAELHRYGILDTPPEKAYDDLTTLAAYICETPFSTITLVDHDRVWFKSERGVGASELGRAYSFCACAVVQPAATIIVEDTLLDPRFAKNPSVLGAPYVRFYAGAPLVTADGHVLGTVCVFDTRPRVPRKEQIFALEALARQVVSLLELRLKMREQERSAAALRTAEKLAVVGRLASSVAHEINNPLQSVTNLLYIAATTEQPEARNSCLSQAQEELERVTHIVTQTLRFHRQSHHAAPTRLAEIVESVRMLFRSRLRHASLSMEIEDRQTTPLRCNSSDLRQVVANLVGNALDAASHKGGSALRVRVRDAVDVRTGGSGVRLTVADNGDGMDSMARTQLFEPFFSTKGERGTGLGLWVSKGILDDHKAVIRVKSSRHPHRHGTVFSIFFPHVLAA